MVIIDDIDLEPVLREVRKELDPLYVKHELLHEMVREFYAKKDYDSETVIYLLRKIDQLNRRLEVLQKVRDNLANLEQGVPFNVNRRVGRYMARFGLSEEQAQLFIDVYKKHKNSMDTEDQNTYSLATLRKVEWVEEESCLHVHFEDAWWHYSVDGSWY